MAKKMIPGGMGGSLGNIRPPSVKLGPAAPAKPGGVPYVGGVKKKPKPGGGGAGNAPRFTGIR